MTKSYWISWYHRTEYSEFELSWPWWSSGYALGGTIDAPVITAETICAAVRAQSEPEAKVIILEAYEAIPVGIEWRFCEQRSDNWTPFSDRFPQADWMQWPVVA